MTFTSPTPRSSTRSARTGRFVVPDTGTAASGKYYVRSTNGGARRKRLDALIKDLEDGADKKERRMRVLFWNR